MSKLFLILSIVSTLNLQASWFEINCSDAKGDFNLTESNTGLILVTSEHIKHLKGKKTWDSNGDNIGLITYKEKDISILQNFESKVCDQEIFHFYKTKVYSANITFSFTDGSFFPKGTFNLSKDYKVLTVPMICSYEAGGVVDCP